MASFAANDITHKHTLLTKKEKVEKEYIFVNPP